MRYGIGGTQDDGERAEARSKIAAAAADEIEAWHESAQTPRARESRSSRLRNWTALPPSSERERWRGLSTPPWKVASCPHCDRVVGPIPASTCRGCRKPL